MLSEKEESKKEEKRTGFFSGISSSLASARERRQGSGMLVSDTVLFALGLIFSRCHILFGAHPLSLALISSLPRGVWQAALGAAVGALSLGRSGIIYALMLSVTLFLRIVIGAGDGAGGQVFSEKLPLRMSVATLGGFVGAVYELLFSGFNETSVLYGTAMVLLPPAFTLAFSGIFALGTNIEKILFGNEQILSLKRRSSPSSPTSQIGLGVYNTRERYRTVYFMVSALVLLFCISLSLSEFTFIGISLSYIFISVAALFVAKRFGALYAAPAGFIISLGISGVQAVSFGLCGLIAGFLFPYGYGYAVIGGGAALSLWSIYSGGLSGFLSTFPEYAIAAAIALPLLRSVKVEKKEDEESAEPSPRVSEMVGTASLAFRGKYRSGLNTLESSLSALSSVLKKSRTEDKELTSEEYKNLALSVFRGCCESCPGRVYCKEKDVFPLKSEADKIAKKLSLGERIKAEDINSDTEFCAIADKVAEKINKSASGAECEKYKLSGLSSGAEDYSLFSRMLNEARMSDDAERALNAEMTTVLCDLLKKHSFAEADGKVFGDRIKHIIIAAEDPIGDKISAPELRRDIENALEIKLDAPEFYRKGNTALMECSSRKMFRIESASASLAADGGEVSGDTQRIFESKTGKLYALISDGMGKGSEAKAASLFTADFLEKVLDFSPSESLALSLLNSALASRADECSATVDLFEFDLYTKEACFIKSGAAPSFIKRGSSLFRIRSRTAPLGLLRTIDSEKISAQVFAEDYIIMLSDGAFQGSEDSPRLIELLSHDKSRTPAELAEKILKEVKGSSSTRDDITVSVIKIISA